MSITDLTEFARRHRRLLVLTGAGCSTESGIPDYRDANGDWKVAAPVTYQAFLHDETTRQRYWARSLVGWPVIGHARPGLAHRALARLEAVGRIEQLLTQNVDGLHSAAGSRRVTDLHGRIDTVRCLACDARLPRARLQQTLLRLNPDWSGLQAGAAPDGDARLEVQDFSRFKVPACPHCSDGLLKPDVVFFGESVPRERVNEALSALTRADAVLVAGSSLMVYSGFRFVQAAVAAGKPVVAVNLGRTRADDLLALKLEQHVGQALDELAEALDGAMRPGNRTGRAWPPATAGHRCP